MNYELDMGKFDKICFDSDVRPLDQAHVISLLKKVNNEKNEFYRTPIIGLQTGGNIFIVDGKHRVEAIRNYNKNTPNNPVKVITFTFLICNDQILTHQ